MMSGRPAERTARARVSAFARLAVAAVLQTVARTLGERGTKLAVDVTTRLPRSLYVGTTVDVSRRGLQLELDLTDNPQRYLYFVGWYERTFSTYLCGELQRGDVFLDVGAHIGIHSLAAADRLRDLGGGRVIAFEASPDTAARLRANAERNHLEVEVNQLALLDRVDTIELFGDPRFAGDEVSVRSAFGIGEPLVSVDARPFDDWAAETGLTRLDVVKMDIEGAELHALRGMRSTLQTLRPRLLAIELKTYLLRQAGTTAAEVEAFLRDVGYENTGVRIDENVVFRPISDR